MKPQNIMSPTFSPTSNIGSNDLSRKQLEKIGRAIPGFQDAGSSHEPLANRRKGGGLASQTLRDYLESLGVARTAVRVLLALVVLPAGALGQKVLLEAEHFADLGGWEVDQQSMDVMGSPYLLAHGLGVPVKDA